MGVPPSGGALHPLLKVKDEFKSIIMEMGYALLPSSLDIIEL